MCSNICVLCCHLGTELQWLCCLVLPQSLVLKTPFCFSERTCGVLYTQPANTHTGRKARASKQFSFILGVKGIRNTLESSMFWLFVLNRGTDLWAEARGKCERLI